MADDKVHAAVRDKELELERLIADEQHAATMTDHDHLHGRPTSHSPTAIISALLRYPLYALREVLRAVNRPRHAEPPSKSSLFTRVTGYPPPPRDPTRDTAWLDGLRGVAAFLVMSYHYHLDQFYFSTEAPYGSDGTFKWDLWRLPYFRIWWCSGHAQVGIFFVLSGFVLSWSGLASIRAGRVEKFAQSLGSATFRRWLRLFLPCWIVGILALIQYWMGLAPSPLLSTKDNFFLQAWDYLIECERFADPFFLERNNWQVLNKYNPTMWTIPLEWNGSLLVFLILLGVCRIRNYAKRTFIIAGICLYSACRARWEFWLFSSGILLSDYIRQAGGFEQLSNSLSTRGRLFWVAMLLLGGWGAGIPEASERFTRPGYYFLDPYIPHSWKDVEGGTRFWWCIAGILIITSLCHLATMRDLFSRPFPRYLGRISFMLYLTHRQVSEILGKPLREAIGLLFKPAVVDGKIIDNGAFINIFGSLVLYFASWMVLGPLALILANWLEILVDGPCVRLCKRIDDAFTGGNNLDNERPGQQELGRLPR
nr:hypothetical protein CFP56_44372 [Quercus suber]